MIRKPGGLMTNKKIALGHWGEEQAEKYLLAKGYELIEKNVRTPYGEIDLVVRKGRRLCFVEVKTRTSIIFGNPEEAITDAKFSHMVESAESYLQEHPDFETDCQIDVVAIQTSTDRKKIEITHFENAAA